MALFDLHRQGGVCSEPATIVWSSGKHAGEPKMRLNEYGVWVGNQERPKFWEEAA
ncbi:hypothetical protein AB0383_20115 [Amycolatopsis sp. NPDC051373]|uniref:hypothetical protein n=1 Tax=Amycolatopsis sp. NPDC051373 TaxID=3155801 RepID=UPI00344D62B0